MKLTRSRAGHVIFSYYNGDNNPIFELSSMNQNGDLFANNRLRRLKGFNTTFDYVNLDLS